MSLLLALDRPKKVCLSTERYRLRIGLAYECLPRLRNARRPPFARLMKQEESVYETRVLDKGLLQRLRFCSRQNRNELYCSRLLVLVSSFLVPVLPFCSLPVCRGCVAILWRSLRAHKRRFEKYNSAHRPRDKSRCPSTDVCRCFDRNDALAQNLRGSVFQSAPPVVASWDFPGHGYV